MEEELKELREKVELLSVAFAQLINDILIMRMELDSILTNEFNNDIDFEDDICL